MSFKSLFVLQISLLTLSRAQLYSGAQQGTQKEVQYPRIKLGGPLGQLMPNGFQLGQNFGSFVNQLIGTAESNAIPAQANNPLISAFLPKQFQQQTQHASHAPQHVQQFGQHAPQAHWTNQQNQQNQQKSQSAFSQPSMASQLESLYSSFGMNSNSNPNSGQFSGHSPQTSSMTSNSHNFGLLNGLNK